MSVTGVSQAHPPKGSEQTRETCRRGDTIIEVIIAITIFCLVSIISITLMNNGVNSAEGSLELVMTRNEIDAQAEALRFIQNSFLAERELDEDQQQYTQLWRRITRSDTDCNFAADCGLAINADDLPDFDIDTCDEAYDEDAMARTNAFVINTRLIEPSDNGSYFDYNNYFGTNSPGNNYAALLEDIIVSAPRHSDVFAPATLYPRIVFSYHGYTGDNTSDELIEQDDLDSNRLYRMIARAEGIWIIAVRGTEDELRGEPEFFDFYIRSCWYESGSDYPSAIGTIVRLYNPEIVE